MGSEHRCSKQLIIVWKERRGLGSKLQFFTTVHGKPCTQGFIGLLAINKNDTRLADLEVRHHLSEPPGRWVCVTQTPDSEWLLDGFAEMFPICRKSELPLTHPSPLLPILGVGLCVLVVSQATILGVRT